MRRATPPFGGLGGLLLFFFLCFGSVHAQTVVLSVDRSAETYQPVYGPNLKKFIHLFISGGLTAGGDEKGAKVMSGGAGETSVGFRFKYKVSSVYSYGFDLSWNAQYFKLKQDGEKILPDTLKNKVERFDISSPSVAIFNRFNFDPGRGDYMGTFLDLGISAHWYAGFTHVTKNDLPDGSTVKSQQTKLPYANSFGYKVFARLGWSHAALYADYRLTDLFKSNYHYPELPRFMAGLELGIFR